MSTSESRRVPRRLAARLVAVGALVLLAVTAVHGAGSPLRAPGALAHGAASVCAGTAGANNPAAGRAAADVAERPVATDGAALRPPDEPDLDAAPALPAHPAPELRRPGRAGAAGSGPSGRSCLRPPGRAPPLTG